MAGKKNCGKCGESHTGHTKGYNMETRTEWVEMKYIGNSRNKKSFAFNPLKRTSFKRTYAGSTTSNKKALVHPDDVEGLKATREWKVYEPPEVEKPETETETKPKRTRSKKAANDS